MSKTEAKWAERVRQWRDSGKGVKEFAEGQPYKASTLRWWGTELRRREEGAAGRSRIPMARVVRRTRSPVSAAASMVVEIAGARIAVERGFDADLLSELVRALAGAR